MNYKDYLLKLINELRESIEFDWTKEDISNKHYDARKKGNNLVRQIITKRFENELRQYNNDSERAYDKFISYKNLDYLRVYIEEMLFLTIDYNEKEFYNMIRNEMRRELDYLYKCIDSMN